MNKEKIAGALLILGSCVLLSTVVITTRMMSQPTTTVQPVKQINAQVPTVMDGCTLAILDKHETTTPVITPRYTPHFNPQAACLSLKLYRVSGAVWKPITNFSEIKAGETITFTVIGVATEGIFDQARFQINGGEWLETTAVNPYGEYYYHYVWPEKHENLAITGQVHHGELGWR